MIQAKEGDNTRPFGVINSPERTEVSRPGTSGAPSRGTPRRHEPIDEATAIPAILSALKGAFALAARG